MATYGREEAQEWAWEALKGQWTTLITPFTDKDEIDEAGMAPQHPPHPKAWHPRRRMHMGNGGVLELDAQ